MAYTAIDDPSAHFHTQLYTGDGSANHAITNDGNSDLQPDFVWIKNRDATDANCLFDSTRGATKRLSSGDATSEVTDADTLDSFASDGFQVDADVKVNTNTESYVAWQWKAGGGSRTTFAESGNNPAGGYQANTTAGFSIVDYTGTGAAGTIAHGLGAIPDVVLVKGKSVANDWRYYHSGNTAAPETDSLKLNDVDATADLAGWWNDTAPTSTVFTVGDNADTNENDSTYIAYLWTNIQGYSKFGGYTGNGSEDGVFVYLGFKPEWIMFKKASATDEPVLLDTTRNPNNPVIKNLTPDRVNAEAAATLLDIDFLSNGFKSRSNQSQLGADGVSYIYIAFAEHPLVTSGGVPCTAR